MKRSLLAVAAIALSASVAQAQMSSAPARPYTIGVSGGVSIPLGDLSSTTSARGAGATTGFNVNGILGYDSPTMPLGFRGEVNYNRFGVDKALTQGASVNYSVFGGSVNGVLNLTSGATASGIRPYVIAGVGYAQLKANGSGVSSDSKSGVMLNGGFGIKIPLSGFQTFAEARYHYVMTKDDTLGSPNATFLPITFGIVF
jgi:opacity protein-like surface antigen